MTERTLNEVIQNMRQNPDLRDTDCFNAYLTTFNLQLIHRLQDITNLDRIDSDEVRRIADFSRVVSVIATDVWREMETTDTGRRTERVARQTRAA